MNILKNSQIRSRSQTISAGIGLSSLFYSLFVCAGTTNVMHGNVLEKGIASGVSLSTFNSDYAGSDLNNDGILNPEDFILLGNQLDDIPGDLNLDRSVTPVDVELLQARLSTFDIYSDLDKNGIVNAIDIALLRNRFKGTGDLNHDGFVSAADGEILHSKMDTSDTEADLNQNGVVDAADFILLFNRLDDKPGDVNSDGSVTSEDAKMIRMNMLTSDIRSDLNKDGIVDTDDLLLLRQRLNGKGDLNRDGFVTSADMIILKSNIHASNSKKNFQEYEDYSVDDRHSVTQFDSNKKQGQKSEPWDNSLQGANALRSNSHVSASHLYGSASGSSRGVGNIKGRSMGVGLMGRGSGLTSDSLQNTSDFKGIRMSSMMGAGSIGYGNELTPSSLRSTSDSKRIRMNSTRLIDLGNGSTLDASDSSQHIGSVNPENRSRTYVNGKSSHGLNVSDLQQRTGAELAVDRKGNLLDGNSSDSRDSEPEIILSDSNLDQGMTSMAGISFENNSGHSENSIDFLSLLGDVLHSERAISGDVFGSIQDFGFYTLGFDGGLNLNDNGMINPILFHFQFENDLSLVTGLIEVITFGNIDGDSLPVESYFLDEFNQNNNGAYKGEDLGKVPETASIWLIMLAGLLIAPSLRNRKWIVIPQSISFSK